MPLMMPAAVMGIHIICTAHTEMPITPNNTKLMTNSDTTPSQLYLVYRLRSIQSVGVP